MYEVLVQIMKFCKGTAYIKLQKNVKFWLLFWLCYNPEKTKEDHNERKTDVENN